VLVELGTSIQRLRCNLDFAASSLLSLWHHDTENAVFQRRGDCITIDISWEAERARELADAALRDPVFGLRLLLHLFLGPRGYTGIVAVATILVLLGLVLVFNRRLVSRFALLGNGTTALAALNGFVSGWGALGVTTLSTSVNDEGLTVGKFDLDVFLLDAGKLAVEFIVVVGLFDVKLWAESPEAVATVWVLGVGGGLIVVVKVVEEAEERMERGRVDACARTEAAR